MARGRIGLWLPMALLLCLPGCASEESWLAERPAGPDLPFAIAVPPGFNIAVRPGFDSATYTVRRGGEMYLAVVNAQFPDFDYATDDQGRVIPAVQQQIRCGPDDEGPYVGRYRRILHPLREDTFSQPDRELPYVEHDFIIVFESLDLAPDKQVVADQIASTISVPGMTQPIQRSALMTCP